jgi:hypothetical protein
MMAASETTWPASRQLRERFDPLMFAPLMFARAIRIAFVAVVWRDNEIREAGRRPACFTQGGAIARPFRGRKQ